MTLRRLFLAVSLATALAPAAAFADDPTAHLLVTLDQVAVNFTAAGGSTVERTEIVKAMDAAGAGMLSRLTIPFNAARERVTVEGASVVLPDESMHLVPPAAITTTAWPGTERSPSYQDAKRTEVDFGQLPPGAVVSVHYTITSDRPWLANDPSFFAMASRTDPLQEISYTISAPSSLHLDVHANAMVGGQTGRGATDTWAFHAAKLPPLFNVASESERLAKSPYIVVAGASAETVAANYLGRIKGAEHVSLELQHLADVLGEDTILPSTLMARDYAWIANNVRLVDVPLALSGPPRRAEDILLDRYGTPEDRVILLQALLKAKSVPSDVVLMPSLPVTWSGLPTAIPTFNDRLMLTVGDGGRLPMDIGSPVVALGSFGVENRGKFGLRIAPRGGSAPLQVPEVEDGKNAGSVATSIIVQPSGAIDGAATVASYGDLAETARGLAETGIPQKIRYDVAERAPVGTQWTVNHMDDPHVPSDEFVLVSNYTVPNYHPLTGSYHMPVPRVITGFGPMDDFASAGGAGLCQRIVRSESTTIHWAMPADITPPHDVSETLPGGLGEYRSTYVYDDAARSLHVERRLQLRANPEQCDSQQQRALAELASRVETDLDSAIEVTPVLPVVAKR